MASTAFKFCSSIPKFLELKKISALKMSFLLISFPILIFAFVKIEFLVLR